MAVSSSSSSSSYSTLSLLIPRLPKLAFGDSIHSFSFPKISAPNSFFSPITFKGFHVALKHVKARRSAASVAFAALVSDTTPVPSTYSGESSMASDSVDDSSVRKHGTDDEDREGSDDVGGLDDQKMTRVCDKLIEIFLVDKPDPTDWRRLLAFSREWDNLRPHFFRRCQERVENENDPGMKHKLLKLGRKLKEVDEDMQRHNELLNLIRERSGEIGELVARRRKDFTKEFFVHLHTIAESYYENPTEQNDLAKLGNTCLATVQAYDASIQSQQAIQAAELKLKDIANSPSLDAACRKIDDLAQKNQLDSATVLLLSKAWSDAKESNMMKDEAKDVLYHLYKTAVGNLQRLMPKEIRILKYLLTINDTDERLSVLNDAFTPGEELEGQNVDCLYTTPQELHMWMNTIINAYNLSSEGTLIREARDLMNPKIIQKIKELKKLVEDKFM